jgi:protoporphyrinogen/coproporphyrinogen III oxidase
VRRFAVVGGGITGLVAARTLKRDDPSATVTLYESSDSFGGKIRTADFAGTPVEDGADSFIDREQSLSRLIDELGLRTQLKEPKVFQGFVWDGRAVKPLPPKSIMGLPLSPWAAWRAGALGGRDAVRVARETRNRTPLTGPDVSVADFVLERFGPAVLDRMVDPILAGTRAGDPPEMSLAAALPVIDQAARSSGSVIRSLRERSGGAPRFLSFAGGMSTLTNVLVADAEKRGVELRPMTSVERVDIENGAPRLILAGHREAADAMLLAVPAYSAAELLRSSLPSVSRDLDKIRFASVASVALSFRKADVPELQGSGLLVTSAATKVLSAATWFTEKWGSADPATTVIRCFVGRAGSQSVLELSDQELSDAAARDLRRIVGTPFPPEAFRVSRWQRGLPEYRVGHLDLIERIEVALRSLPVALAGASYRGSGIPDCVAQGESAARRLLHEAG